MTSNHHAPYDLGYTRATMDGTTSRKTARFSKSLKAVLSSDCRSQLAYMKSGIASNRGSACRGEYVPGLVHTARHTMRVCNTQSRWGNLLEPAV